MAAHPQPVHSVEPYLDTPDADLLAGEAELTELLLEHERLEAAWPKGPTAIDRARIGRRLEEVLDDIAEIHELIADARPRTLAGAAVLLRGALAAIEAHDCRSAWREPERVLDLNLQIAMQEEPSGSHRARRKRERSR